jgi:uncharacterized membrane protein (DUF2068 family)
MSEVEPKRHVGLQIIAAFKFIKAAALITGGLAALGMLTPNKVSWVQDWLEQLALGQGHALASSIAARVLALLDLAGPTRLRQVALGAFLYATLFLVEGVGLARQRRWAEYLTVIVTTSFLPLEIGALYRRWTLPRAATLVLNVAVVAYLLWQLREGRRYAMASDARKAARLRDTSIVS